MSTFLKNWKPITYVALAIVSLVLGVFGAMRLIQPGTDLNDLLANVLTGFVCIILSIVVALIHSRFCPHKGQSPASKSELVWSYSRLGIIAMPLIAALVFLAAGSIALVVAALVLFFILLIAWWRNGQAKALRAHFRLTTNKQQKWFTEAARVTPWLIGIALLLYGGWAIWTTGKGWIFGLAIVYLIAYALYQKYAHALISQPESKKTAANPIPYEPAKFTKGFGLASVIVTLAVLSLTIVLPVSNNLGAAIHSRIAPTAQIQIPGISSSTGDGNNSTPGSGSTPTEVPTTPPTPTPTPITASALPPWTGSNSFEATVDSAINGLIALHPDLQSYANPAVKLLGPNETILCSVIMDVHVGAQDVVIAGSASDSPVIWCAKDHTYYASQTTLDKLDAPHAQAAILTAIGRWWLTHSQLPVRPGATACAAGYVLRAMNENSSYVDNVLAPAFPADYDQNTWVGTGYHQGMGGCPQSA